MRKQRARPFCGVQYRPKVERKKNKHEWNTRLTSAEGGLQATCCCLQRATWPRASVKYLSWVVCEAQGSTLTLPQWGTVRLGSRRRGGKCNSGLIDTPQSVPVCLRLSLCVCVCVHTVDFRGSNYRIDFDASTPRRKHLLLVMRVNVVWSPRTKKKMNDPAEMPQIRAKVITNRGKRRGSG